MVAFAGAAGRGTGWVRTLMSAAERFRESRGDARAVLFHAASVVGPASAHPLTWGWAQASLTAALAIALAASALVRHRPSSQFLKRLGRVLSVAMWPLKRAHSGHLGDDVAWLTGGVAAWTIATAVALR